MAGDGTAASGRVLVKLRSGGAMQLADGSAQLRPLFGAGSEQALSGAAEPAWFIADLDQDQASPWDLAHHQVARRLGIDAAEVLFVEPDLEHTVYPDPMAPDGAGAGAALAVGDECAWMAQDSSHGRASGHGFAWHLDDDHSQLAAARTVEFTEPRTRVAHIDTGYDRGHATCPTFVARHLERSFVSDGRDPASAQDPDNDTFLLDNSGHGTGTIGILAGTMVEREQMLLGGAPQAEVLPLRIADRVVLFRTSALAQAIDYAAAQRCEVATLSMGGLPSRAWAEAVDRAYESGLLICAAAGNNVGFSPPRTVVYPARYDRVLAVCGVMADGRPYDLRGAALEGSFGPPSAMDRALAAFTPNIPWARFGCGDAVRLDGQGTSAATPQVAAAAALWLEKYKRELPQGWRRVEAVRYALFTSARKIDAEHFGNGILKASAALAERPRVDREKAPRAVGQNSFAFFRLITGLGLDTPTPREEMFNLELVQRWLVNPTLIQLEPDPRRVETWSPERVREVLDAIIADEGASLALRRQAEQRYPLVGGGQPAKTPATPPSPATAARSAADPPPVPSEPPRRRLRVYTLDPSLAGQFDAVSISRATVDLRWEQLANADEPGALGEYFAVDDVDAGDYDYGVIDLDDPRLISVDGWAPSEGNPLFHQQMTYAIAAKTVEVFERALGRPVWWAPKRDGGTTQFRRRLTLRPHAMTAANAYYSPEEVSLRFGYFDAAAGDPGSHWPGERVYTCLSADIIAHETTHAILDGMYWRFREPTNVDVLALHEGFADIIALLQHFTIPALVEQQMTRTRGDLTQVESLLGGLAVQVGQASGRGGPLRDAIGKMVDGRWQRGVPDPSRYATVREPHARGSILVAAVFDAFLAIFNNRTADLLRLATGGTGILPGGAVHPDLVGRLAAEASRAANHVLNMVIRALDYLPPVDVTFFDCLRALITADVELVPDDTYNYRVAFIEAFRRHGVRPVDDTPGRPVSFAVETLRWRGLDLASVARSDGDAVRGMYHDICLQLRRFADEAIYHADDRQALFDITARHRSELKSQVVAVLTAAKTPGLETYLGIQRGNDAEEPFVFEIEELRRVTRVSPDGRQRPQVVVTITQEVPKLAQGDEFPFRGGTTLILDLVRDEIIYSIGKGIGNAERLRQQTDFVTDSLADPLRAVFYGPGRSEPFALLHTLSGQG